MPKRTMKSTEVPKKISQGRGHSRHISIRSDRRVEPDLRKIARAVVALAIAQAEADAAQQDQDVAPVDEGRT